MIRIEDAFANTDVVFIDTAPVIYHVEAHPLYSSATDWVFGRISAGDLQAVTSSITLAECLVHPYRSGDESLADQFRRVITRAAHTRFMGVDPVAERAARIRAQDGFSLTDSLQLAAAEAAGCDGFLTNDRTLSRFRGLRIILISELIAT